MMMFAELLFAELRELLRSGAVGGKRYFVPSLCPPCKKYVAADLPIGCRKPKTAVRVLRHKIQIAESDLFSANGKSDARPLFIILQAVHDFRCRLFTVRTHK